MRCLWLSLLLAGCATSPAGLAITHVTVIDATAGARADQTVVVAGDRIVSVGPSATATVPPRARVIDGGGKYLIPGLWDMHVHTGPPEQFAGWYLANGVVGVRDMGGEHDPPVGNLSLPIEQLRAFRERVRRHEARGPTMFLGGPMVDGDPPAWPNAVSVKTPADVPAALAKVKARGVDFIKVYGNLDHDTYLAIAAEAKRLGLDFAGHVPFKVSYEEASDAGQKSFEHLFGVWPSCSSIPDLQEQVETWRNGTNRAQRRPAFEKILDGLDDAVCAPTFAKLIANHSWQDPTLVQWSHLASAYDPANLTDPRLAQMPASVRKAWDVENPFYFKNGAMREIAPRLFVAQVKILTAMHRAGVPILAGSDSGNPFVYPGYGLHEELALLVSAGLTPLQALEAATLSPARYFKLEQTHGTIAGDKVADLVLLSANPLESIGNTRRIVAVMHDGEWLDRDQLDRMVAGAPH
jgi:imidazolonepropionase-like amidohydrolase